MQGERRKHGGSALDRPCLFAAAALAAVSLLASEAAGLPDQSAAAKGMFFAKKHNCVKAVPLLGKVVLNEGERRVVTLRLAPLRASGSAPDRAPRAPRARAEPPTTTWLGFRYYGVVLPQFLMNAVADGGRTMVVPGGALTYTTTTANDLEVTVALGYLSFRMGGTPFKPHGEPDTEWELTRSTLQALTATVDLMWGFRLDQAGVATFRLGGAVGVGWMFSGDLFRTQVYPKSGKPGDPSTYVECNGP